MLKETSGVSMCVCVCLYVLCVCVCVAIHVYAHYFFPLGKGVSPYPVSRVKVNYAIYALFALLYSCL